MHVVTATRHLRRLRGGSQSHLLECDDGRSFVTKFQHNPQATRVLANEYICSRLMKTIGLTVPDCAIVQIDAEFLKANPEVSFTLAHGSYQPAPGLHFGSRFVEADTIYDYVPATVPIKNVREFAGVLAFDKWTCQSDGRQAVFYKNKRERGYRTAFIDHGYAFNCSEWSFPDSPLRGVFARSEVYRDIAGWEAFDPWLTRIENLSRDELCEAAENLPREWYGEVDELGRLLHTLLQRRSKVRGLITAFRNSSRLPFPNWKEVVSDREVRHTPTFPLCSAEAQLALAI